MDETQANVIGRRQNVIRFTSRDTKCLLRYVVRALGGVAVFIVGVTLVNGYEVEKDVKMSLGNTVTIGEYTIRLDALKDLKGPNYTGVEGSMAILVDGKEVDRMFPQKRLYTVQQMPMTEAAIDTGFTRDLYISLGEPLNDGSWVVRVYLKPFVDWIWGGAFLMALGGVLAVSDRRYRRASQDEENRGEKTASS